MYNHTYRWLRAEAIHATVNTLLSLAVLMDMAEQESVVMLLHHYAHISSMN